MKNLLLIICIFSSLSLFAQSSEELAARNQPKFNIKTNPLSLIVNTYKLGLDYAIDESSTLEI